MFYFREAPESLYANRGRFGGRSINRTDARAANLDIENELRHMFGDPSRSEDGEVEEHARGVFPRVRSEKELRKASRHTAWMKISIIEFPDLVSIWQKWERFHAKKKLLLQKRGRGGEEGVGENMEAPTLISLDLDMIAAHGPSGIVMESILGGGAAGADRARKLRKHLKFVQVCYTGGVLWSRREFL